MVKDSVVDGIFKELEKEFLNKHLEDVKFQDESQKRNYTVRAQRSPPYSTFLHYLLKEGEGTEVGSLMLVSTDTEQIGKIIDELSKGNRKVIDAFDWASQQSLHNSDAAYVLCYDFASDCPVVEVTKKSWVI